MTRNFSLGTVLTVTTGRMLSTMDDLYDILNYMTGDSLMTLQLVRAGEICGPVLLAQHPALVDVEVPVPEAAVDKKTYYSVLVAELAEKFGEELPVEPLEYWQHGDPIEELVEITGKEPIAVIFEE